MHTNLQARRAEVQWKKQQGSVWIQYQQNELPQSKVIFTFFRL